MKIRPFAVEQWMNAHESACRYNLAETCVESLTIAELLDLAQQKDSILEELLPLKMTYGAIEGSGSMSKAFSLAGLRLGWICGPVDVLRAAEIHRDYNTISVGIIDDVLSSIALESRDKILARSRALVRTNLATLDRWMQSEQALSYVKPRAGTIALLKYAVDMPAAEFCLRLLRDTGVLFTPGSAFEVEGTVRIGYANNHAVLQEGLSRTSAFLRGLRS